MSIICARTARRFCREKQIDLRDCAHCGGLIDIRSEAWRRDGNRSFHYACPPAALVRAAGAPVAEAPVEDRPSGRVLLAALDERRDLVHLAALEAARDRCDHDYPHLHGQCLGCHRTHGP